MPPLSKYAPGSHKIREKFLANYRTRYDYIISMGH